MANSYNLKDSIRLSVTFSVNSTPTDPTSLVLTLKDPYSTITTPTPIRDSAGVYHYDVVPTVAGMWSVRWEGNGTAQGAGESQFYVKSSLVTP